MTNGSTPTIPGWVIGFMVVLLLAVVVLGFMLYNINSNMAVMDQNGRDLTAWARTTAAWTTHVNAFHLKKDHDDAGMAPDHIAPPPDPPPDW